MSVENIPIVTSKERFFLEYLTLKKPIIEAVLTKINRKKTSISEMPMRVLSQLLYYNDQFKDMDPEKKWESVFSRETRLEIMQKLGLKEHLLNTYITQLRTIKILDGRKIRDIFVVYANDKVQLSFIFKLNGHKE